MDQRKLVRRVSDGSDRRRVLVKLTKEGKTLASRLVSEAREHEENLLSDLADTDAARIKPVLQVLLSRL
jgi:DNA-binding MarR family transcriptional regulator